MKARGQFDSVMQQSQASQRGGLQDSLYEQLQLHSLCISFKDWVFELGFRLVDIVQFTEGGNDIYIKLAASELVNKRNIWKVIVIVSTLGAFILIICIFFWWRRNKSMKDCWNKNRMQGSMSRLLFSQKVKINFSGPSDFGDGEQQEKGSEIQIFSFESLVAATRNFNDANKLGYRGFGHVYK